MRGDRLSTLVSFEALKLAAGMVLLSPNIPLLFMGEEYGEEAPFSIFYQPLRSGIDRGGEKGKKGRVCCFQMGRRDARSTK